ncbi:2-oxoacid dehydrogenase/acyltransferase catalytic subunit [Streptomyces sp. KhCrAH-43]|uniref:2-oxo acid dehydrogenase subunit E2 n=1 Tax=Streptomyces TaxID=1883 RepID=UPI0003606400|nr:2-oxo acid dehydrogenase subunit E2 [Streptomyces sp. KhCrAH-43]MYS36964.1 acyltransferase [Streptomyces sp. SID4920]MYX69436.1 acyltransferase [Streptomyces sp. SID8373]RAJ62288.1 2-oxoacid dehydrogenase/acyltransferase catalytic subunit [Streptomyces sp. KhCrAH-43]
MSDAPEAGAPLPRQRRHTLFFLEVIRDFSPVFLDTEVDMSRVLAHRASALGSEGVRYSTTSYVLRAAGRVLAKHPDANAAVSGGPLRPRIAHYPFVNGKVALDRVLDGRRVVLGTIVPDVHEAELPAIQAHLARIRDGDPERLPEFEGVRKLHRAGWTEGRRAFRKAAHSLALRPHLNGTFAVTSLGHRAVDSFHSVGGTTTTFGVGRVLDRPVVRDGRIVVAPVLRLSLAFDHRVIDGAEAADVLTEVKEALESV